MFSDPLGLGLRADPRWHAHPTYLALGADSVARAPSYRALLMETLDPDDIAAIRDHLRQERALGSPRFKAMVEKTLNRPTGMRLPGRPTGRPGEDSNGNVLWPSGAR
jgi:putative transposase